jgi:hypothetical protein
VEITFDGPVEVDGSPHLVNVLGEIAGTKTVLRICHPVFADKDGKVWKCLNDPFQTFEHTVRLIGQETLIAEQRIFWIGPAAEHGAWLSQIEADEISGVVIESKVILSAFRLGYTYRSKHRAYHPFGKRHWEAAV